MLPNCSGKTCPIHHILDSPVGFYELLYESLHQVIQFAVSALIRSRIHMESLLSVYMLFHFCCMCMPHIWNLNFRRNKELATHSQLCIADYKYKFKGTQNISLGPLNILEAWLIDLYKMPAEYLSQHSWSLISEKAT